MIQAVTGDGIPSTRLAFSQAVVSGGWLFSAGIGPFDPERRVIVGTTIEEQTRQVLTNVATILEHAGMEFENVVKTTVHLKSLEDFLGMDQTYRTFFGAGPYPARITLRSHMRSEEMLVEMEVIAHR